MTQLGELETLVMEALWRDGPATVREVCDRLGDGRDRAYTTVMTTLDRLHKKGHLAREKEGMAWRYVPALDKDAFERTVADALAREIVHDHGEAGLAAFVEAAAGVDGALLDRLAELVDARRRGR